VGAGAAATGAGSTAAGSGRFMMERMTAPAIAATTMAPPMMKRPELLLALGGTESGAPPEPKGAMTGTAIGMTFGAAATGAAAMAIGGRGA
jgi:hypothetical protein